MSYRIKTECVDITYTIYYKDESSLIRHRENGPAYEAISKDGFWFIQSWWINDILHRTDGPAVICNGEKEFYIHGDPYEEEEYWAIIRFGGFV